MVIMRMLVLLAMGGGIELFFFFLSGSFSLFRGGWNEGYPCVYERSKKR